MRNPHVYKVIEKTRLKAPFFDVTLAEQYGQCGEDLIVAGLLRAWVTRQGRNIADLTYLEIGANHPVATSASYLLHRCYGMRGVLVEANPDLIDGLQKTRPGDVIVHAAVTNEERQEVILIVPQANELATVVPEFLQAWPGEGASHRRHVIVKAQRINDLLEQYFAHQSPAYMSLDIEGFDLDILQDMDFNKFRPLIIQVEPSNHFIIDNDQNILSFLQQQSYQLVARTDVNMIFVSDAFWESSPPIKS